MKGLQIVQARVKHSIHVCFHPQRNFGLNGFPTHRLYTIFRSLHSKKLHILGFRARMVCTNSLVIFFFSLSDNGTYHFWSRSLPCRLNRSMNCICKDTRQKWIVEKSFGLIYSGGGGDNSVCVSEVEKHLSTAR